MKRYGFIIVFAAAIGTLFTAFMAGAGVPKKIENSKHNMSSTPSAEQGTIKSDTVGGTTEICVFCHTPHSGNTEAPLWNRSLYQSAPAGYAPYTSDVMSALTYSTMENPYLSSGSGAIHAKTRICLSCHDGTIAIGKVVNLPTSFGNADPNTTNIAMVNTSSGKMPTGTAGYLGVNFQDDHPVAIQHNPGSSPGQDPELTSIGALSKVRLYNIVSGQIAATRSDGGYIECTSCHDAHDNQYGKFLIDDNQGSKICLTCHTKTGYNLPGAAESIHTKSTTGYAPTTGGNPATLGADVGSVKCMDCHYPHRAGVTSYGGSAVPSSGKYLLTYQEEKSCFNTTNRWNQATTACHGGSSDPNINILNAENATPGKSHYTQNGSWTERHEATEAKSTDWINNPSSLVKWHVECADCHNPHGAGKTLHTAPTNAVTSTSPLYGTGGVTAPSSYASWALTPTQSTWPGGAYIQPMGTENISSTGVQYEYEICFKCHTDFAWGTGISIPDSPSLGGSNKMTNQAMEFNPGNASYHPVVSANTVNSQGTYIGGWNNGSTQTMYCSDCHTKEVSSPRPQGPHGSSNNFILTKAFNDSYGNRQDNEILKQPSTDLCFTCHDPVVYLNSTQNKLIGANETGFYLQGASNYNLHTQHAFRAQSASNLNFTTRKPWPYRCVDCHTRIVHGLNEKAMILAQNNLSVPGVYSGLASGVSGTYKLLSYTPSGAGYVQGNCTTVSGCHSD